MSNNPGVLKWPSEAENASDFGLRIIHAVATVFGSVLSTNPIHGFIARSDGMLGIFLISTDSPNGWIMFVAAGNSSRQKTGGMIRTLDRSMTRIVELNWGISL